MFKSHKKLIAIESVKILRKIWKSFFNLVFPFVHKAHTLCQGIIEIIFPIILGAKLTWKIWN